MFTNEPGTPLTPKFVEIVHRAQCTESDGTIKPILNVYHFRQEGGPALGSKSTLSTQFANILLEPLMAALSITYVSNDITVRWMDNPADAPQSFPYSGTGSVTGDRLPSYASVCVQLKTPSRGRSYRGSKHYAPIAESQTLLDHLTAGGITLWEEVETALSLLNFIDGGNGTFWSLCIISTTLSDFSVTPPLFTGDVCNAFKANARLGTMVRRKEGARNT